MLNSCSSLYRLCHFCTWPFVHTIPSVETPLPLTPHICLLMLTLLLSSGVISSRKCSLLCLLIPPTIRRAHPPPILGSSQWDYSRLILNLSPLPVSELLRAAEVLDIFYQYRLSRKEGWKRRLKDRLLNHLAFKFNFWLQIYNNLA